MKFENAKEMLDLIQSGTDLYNVKTGDYVFLYSEQGHIATYKFDITTAKSLSAETYASDEEFWSGRLGFGGNIYDNGLAWCEEHYKTNGWEKTSVLDKQWRCITFKQFIETFNFRYFSKNMYNTKCVHFYIDNDNDNWFEFGFDLYDLCDTWKVVKKILNRRILQSRVKEMTYDVDLNIVKVYLRTEEE